MLSVKSSTRVHDGSDGLVCSPRDDDSSKDRPKRLGFGRERLFERRPAHRSVSFGAGDPDFVEYTHFILDEVHEEDRDTEFLLVALRELVARRREAYDASPDTAPPPLKLVLMSATLGLQKLGDYFGGCPSCSMGGTNFPVTTFFLEDVLKQTK